jgi:hypothetical protein
MLLLSEVKRDRRGWEGDGGVDGGIADLSSPRLILVDSCMISCASIFPPAVRLACSTLVFLSL